MFNCSDDKGLEAILICGVCGFPPSVSSISIVIGHQCNAAHSVSASVSASDSVPLLTYARYKCL